MFIFVLKFITVDIQIAWFPHGKKKIKQYQGERRKLTTAIEELKCYFEKLIEPLITNNSLEELFNKLKDETMKKFDEKISEQNANIEKLESIITIHENTIDQLSIKRDDKEQYSRRSSLRIHGVEVK